MNKEYSIHEMECEFADLVHQQFQKELYSLNACKVDYTEERMQELKLLIGLKKSDVCCPKKKEKIHAAQTLPNTGNASCATIVGSYVVFQFVQPTPAGVWIIPHNLGYNPQVTIFDNYSNPIPGSIRYIDRNSLQITFTYLVSGRANLYSN